MEEAFSSLSQDMTFEIYGGRLKKEKKKKRDAVGYSQNPTAFIPTLGEVRSGRRDTRVHGE